MPSQFWDREAVSWVVPKGDRARLFGGEEDPAFRNWNRREYGGALSLGKRKSFRPIDTRRTMHLVLRSSRAKGEHSMLRPKFEKRVRRALYRLEAEGIWRRPKPG
jgi:hypothetical protein